MIAGFAALVRYEGFAAPRIAAPAVIPNITPAAARPTLFLALHPRCPCSAATMDELAKIYSRAPGSFAVKAFVYRPAAEADSWTNSPTVSSLARYGAEIQVDPDGRDAAALGLTVSGQTLLYSPEGRLLFNGGITGGRGHRGDNAGADALFAHVTKAPGAAATSRAYGCPLSDSQP